ncbi:hypothetical protein DFH29DRAFT_1007178 [Suillus ampliporus]|nr:hypothetical protein DFH29DRAFT_1007178 [Suillus ampliporus]
MEISLSICSFSSFVVFAPSHTFKAAVMHTCGGKGNILLETIVYSEIGWLTCAACTQFNSYTKTTVAFTLFLFTESATITKAESSVETMQDLASELCTLAGDINKKKLHLKKIKADIQSGNFDECLSAKATKAQSMQDQHDTLDLELHSLSMQVESRVRLDLKQAEMRSKASDTKNM